MKDFYNKLDNHSLNYGLSTDTILDPCQYFLDIIYKGSVNECYFFVANKYTYIADEALKKNCRIWW